MDKAEKMLDAIMGFNRKERYHLIRHAVTGGPMTLSDRFRQEVGDALGVAVPDNAYVAMDYHLDWLSAAYHFASKGGTLDTAMSRDKDYGNYPNNKGEPILAGSILDTDLLVAFRKNDRVAIILVEAKADTGWRPSQIADKADRLSSMFGDGRDSSTLVEPYFLLLGPPISAEQTITRSQVDGNRFPSWFFVKEKDDNEPVIPYLTMHPDRPLYTLKRTQKKNGRYEGWTVMESTRFHFNNHSDEE